MLKKIIFTILILTIITGCTSSEEHTSKNPLSDQGNKHTDNDQGNNNTKDQKQDQGNNNQDSENNTTNEDNTSDSENTSKEAQEDVEMETEPQYIVNKNWMIKPIAEANDKVLLLTIDDAPNKYSIEMAEILKELDVKAIFFVNGHFIDTDEEKETLKKIYNMGFTIGNHTMTHAYLWWKESGNRYELTETEQYEEIVDLSQVIEEIVGEKPKFFRAPFGQNTEYASQLVREEGMVLMNWSVGSLDWQFKDPNKVKDQVLTTLHSGGNILLHDRKWSKEALKGIILGAREQGYQFVDPDLITFPE